jgi:hypothetical protein
VQVEVLHQFYLFMLYHKLLIPLVPTQFLQEKMPLLLLLSPLEHLEQQVMVDRLMRIVLLEEAVAAVDKVVAALK